MRSRQYQGMRVRRLAPMSRKSVIHNKSPAVWQHFLKDLCNNLSLHGLPHIARQDRFLCERADPREIFGPCSADLTSR
ncbi:hypothetical protein J6590_064164 [Homalodisca vitripennis]|nr:hypothetical protein J6590_064164 [Homalodisca vitripennis]